MDVGSQASSSEVHKEQIIPVADATVPYWRTELSRIDEYHSTPELPSQCDIAIIGAGIGGLSAAIALGKSGHKVTVYESAAALAEV